MVFDLFALSSFEIATTFHRFDFKWLILSWKVERKQKGKNLARHCLQKLNVNLSLKLLSINGATKFTKADRVMKNIDVM